MSNRPARLLAPILIVCMLGAALSGCGATTRTNEDAVGRTTGEEAAAEARASLSGSLLGLAADRLAAGDAEPAVEPKAGTAMGARRGAQTPDIDALLGGWLFPDGTAGVIIDDEPSVTFVFENGAEVGPLGAESIDEALYVPLAEDDIAALFGEQSGLEEVSLAFLLGETADELLMVIVNETTDQQEAFALARADGTPEPQPEEPPADADAQLEYNVDLLVEACLYYAYQTGERPSVTDVAPDGVIGELLTEWPTNPYTGEPMEYVSRQQKAGNYEVDSRPASVLGMFAKRIRGYYENGESYEVVVPYEQVGLD